MSEQNQPLPQYSLSASNRTARDLANNVIPHTDMAPPYQRGAVWTLDQRAGLVKSWVMGVPIPAVILNDRATRVWEGDDPYQAGGYGWAVVDGKQRLETAESWFAGELAVPAWWFDSDYIDARTAASVTYRHLSRRGQMFFATKATLPVVVAKLPTVRAEAELYLLVNGAGTAQTAEDMARAERAASETESWTVDKEAEIRAFAHETIATMSDYINDDGVDLHVRSALASAEFALSGLLRGIRNRDELAAANAEDEANRAED